MNAATKHFRTRHPGWNTVSLWKCIKNLSDSHGRSELCVALKELQLAAFEMFFNRKDRFPDLQDVNSNIDRLSFVKILKICSNGDEVKYTFYHPTFLEFFAALHLMDLQREELLYLFTKEHQNGTWHRKNPWLFYFGLIGASYRVDYVSAILKQFSMYKVLIGKKIVPAPLFYI